MLGLVDDDTLHSMLKWIMQPLLNTACLGMPICKCAVLRFVWLATDKRTISGVISQTGLTMIDALIVQSCYDVGPNSTA